ncbi:MAG: glycosyltransferase family 2 protein [Verrucomicrobia bacterium]|nr:glycosyltransferase family 2 protein [Verrucomicrobiota bacterium]
MMTPLVSVCLPNLNTRPFLEERMETLLAQTFKEFEIVISDNYSNDGAWEFFQKFKGDPRVQLAQAPRQGMYANWNECLRRARGKYCYMATSDDTCSPTLLEKMLAALERLPDVRIGVCGLQVIDEKGRAIPYLERLPHWQFLGEWMHTPSIRNSETEFLLHAWFGTIWFSMTSVLFERSVLERAGYFRTDLCSHADQEWAMRAALCSDVSFMPDRLATWRYWEGQGTPHVLDVKTTRIWLEAINSVLDDEKAGIPETWRRVKDWDRHLLASKRAYYLSSFRLWSKAALKTPGLFLKGLVDAWRYEPALLWSQARRGFKWSDSFDVDRVRGAGELIKLFNAPWPPTKISP